MHKNNRIKEVEFGCPKRGRKIQVENKGPPEDIDHNGKDRVMSGVQRQFQIYLEDHERIQTDRDRVIIFRNRLLLEPERHVHGEDQHEQDSRLEQPDYHPAEKGNTGEIEILLALVVHEEVSFGLEGGVRHEVLFLDGESGETHGGEESAEESDVPVEKDGLPGHQAGEGEHELIEGEYHVFVEEELDHEAESFVA